MGSRSRIPNDAKPIASRLVDDMVDAFDDWLEECARVQDCYSHWATASRSQAPSAFVAYNAAVDREERAAGRYREAAGRVGDNPRELRPIMGPSSLP